MGSYSYLTPFSFYCFTLMSILCIIRSIYPNYVDTLSAMPPTHRHHNRRFNPGQSSNPCNNGLTDCNQSAVESPISLARGSCKDNYHPMKSSGGGCGQGSDFRGQGGDFRGQPPPFVPPPHPYTKVFIKFKVTKSLFKSNELSVCLSTA